MTDFRVSEELKNALQTAVSVGTVPEQHRGSVGNASVILASAVFKLLSEVAEMDAKLAKLGTLANDLTHQLEEARAKDPSWTR